MSTANFVENQRQSFRCPVVDSRQECALEVGASTVPGRLLDESAGGFLVLFDRPPGVGVDQTATLRTDSGQFDVRVTRVMEEEAPEGCGVQDSTEAPGPWFRLGLCRLGEASPPPPPISVFAENLRCRLQQWCPSGGPSSVPVAFLVVAAVVVPLGLGALIWHVGKTENVFRQPGVNPWSKSASWYDNLSAAGSPPPAVPRESGAGPGWADLDRIRPAFGGGDQSERPRNPAPNNGEKALRESVRRLSGTAALLLPTVAAKLQLTDQQRAAIRQIETATAAAVRQLSLDAGLQGASRRELAERRDELLAESQRKALELLTDQQRAEWQKLAAKPPADERPAAQ
jgi:hypothetical protein